MTDAYIQMECIYTECNFLKKLRATASNVIYEEVSRYLDAFEGLERVTESYYDELPLLATWKGGRQKDFNVAANMLYDLFARVLKDFRHTMDVGESYGLSSADKIETIQDALDYAEFYAAPVLLHKALRCEWKMKAKAWALVAQLVHD